MGTGWVSGTTLTVQMRSRIVAVSIGKVDAAAERQSHRSIGWMRQEAWPYAASWR